MSEGDTDWWYAGLRAVGERPFSSAELEELHDVLSEATRRIVLVIGAIFGVPLLVVASFYVPGLRVVIMPGAILVASVTWYWRAVAAELRYGRAVRIDLRRGIVVQCEGTLDDLLVSRALLLDEPRSMIRISAERDERVTIEVLPRSQRVWSCDGRRAHHLVVVPKSSTAPAPEHARMAANFVQPMNAALAVHQRALTRAEVTELEGYAPAVDPARYVIAGLLVVGSIAGFWLALQRRTDSLLIAAVFSIAAFFAIVRLFRDASRHRRISRDVDSGAVIIVRARDGDLLGDPKEFLPHSGIPWTIGGVPAAWRRMFR
jgi:hypothetical protein